MKSLLKNLGPVIILIGVAILAVYFFTNSNANIFLATGGIVMFLGLVYHIVINRVVD